MASQVPQLTTGTTIAFATSGFTANITGFGSPGFARTVHDTSHLGSSGPRSKIAGDLSDTTSLTMTIQFNPDTSPPRSGCPEQVTITYPSGATWIFAGVVTEYKPSEAALEELMMATLTVEVSGGITSTTGTTSTTAA